MIIENFTYYLENLNLFTTANFLKLAISLTILMCCIFISEYLSYFIIKLFNLKEKEKSKITKNGFYKPLKFFFRLLGLYLAILFLNISPELNGISTKVFRISGVLLLTTGIANFFSTSKLFLKRFNLNLEDPKSKAMATFLARIIKVVVYSIAGIIILTELGYNISGLITSLGVGGIIVALAAQDTVKNLFGGVVVITDKPFGVGDWIETPSIEGIVEDITFRSTRIRTFANALVTVPNSIITNENIINWSKINKRRILFNLNVAFDIPLKKVYKSIKEINDMLVEHEHVLNDNLHVHLDQIKDSGLNIIIYFFTDVIAYEEFLHIKENINFEILNILEKNKTPLAYNSQTVHVKNSN